MTPQPTGTEARVCALVAQRQQLGLRKYGTTVAQNPLSLREWLWHSIEEKCDDLIYMMRAVEELDRLEDDRK